MFVSKRGTAIAAIAFNIIRRAGKLAGLALSVHLHMLRHAGGFYLATHDHDTRAIQAYLRHKNIQHTIRYTEITSERFKNFWLN